MQCAANMQASLATLQQQQQQRWRKQEIDTGYAAAVAPAASLTAAVAVGVPASAPVAATAPVKQGQAVSQAEVGRATWIFLHTLAAQYPERPSRQQRRDVRNLVSSCMRWGRAAAGGLSKCEGGGVGIFVYFRVAGVV